MTSKQKLVIRFPAKASSPDDESGPSSRAMDVDSDPDNDNENESAGPIDVDIDDVDNDQQTNVISVPVKRSRGRPRGSNSRIGASGSGIRGRRAGSGTPTATSAAGRARGRGRGRGRGRAITIKLTNPKREDGEEGEDEEDGEGDAEGDSSIAEEPLPAATAPPVGGGKPFRKIQNQIYIIDGDEFITPSSPTGDTKIDSNGNLLAGREFKASTFTLPNRHPQRQYMLAIEAARTSGFRDSLYYFRRNLLAFKLNATQPEKDYLISQGKLGPHLKTRSVTLITARSAFKLHGSKMVKGGRWVVDDYYEDKALEAIKDLPNVKPGDLVGDLVDPNAESTEANAAREKASSGASRAFNLGGDNNAAGPGTSIYRPGGPTTIFAGNGLGPFSDGPLNPVRKSLLNRDGVTEENWMWMMAERVREADEQWKRVRNGAGFGRKVGSPAGVIPGGGVGVEARGNVANATMWEVNADEDLPLGMYEPHTGTVFFRSNTQPTRARWEPQPQASQSGHERPEQFSKTNRILGGTKTGSQAWGLAYVDTVME